MALGALALSSAQRRLSTPARTLRRRVTAVTGTIALADGTGSRRRPDAPPGPLERALRALSWGVVLLAAGLAVARLT